MDTSYKHLVELLQSTHRCRREVQDLAGKMASFDANEYNYLVADLTKQGEDQALGILLNVVAVNKIQLDPQVLVDSLKAVDILLDINFPYKYQKNDAIGPLLTAALAEDLSWERQTLAAHLAAELTIKFDEPRQPVKKTLWQLSREVSSFEARLIVDSALEILEVEDTAHTRTLWFSNKDVLKLLPKERPPIVIGDGFTVRRPVAKLGRNDPCHCGSGKKYKKCCRANDDELLRDASSYEGVTKSQILSEPSLIQDTAPIAKMRAYELKQLKPSLMNDDQLLAGYRRADLFGLRELAYEMLLELKNRPDKEEFAVGHMCDLFHEVLRCQDREVAEKLTQHIPSDSIYFNEADKLCHALMEDSAMYSDFDKLCRMSVCKDEQSIDNHLLELSYALEKILPALSVILGRAAIVSEPERWLDNDMLLDSIQRSRISLDLEPWGDPIEEYLEWTYEKDIEQSLDKNKDQKIEQLKAQLTDARNKTILASKDLRVKENELAVFEKKISNAGITAFEKNPESTGPSEVHDSTLTSSAAHTNDSKKQIHKLRGKIASLKGEINSHQESRRQYRCKLKEAEQVISKLSSQQQAPGVDSEQKENPDSALILPKKVLIPEFTNSFKKSCDSLQQSIVAKALQAAVGFAARDDGILRQATGLERFPGVFRVRIGLHYRLLVRQTPEETLQVMDIIPRSQLETWIRRHTR